MSEHIRRCPLPEDLSQQLFLLHTKALLREASMATNPNDPALIAARTKLVRLYLHNPAIWPDGIEHRNGEKWFTGREDYWIALAIEAQTKLDAQAELAAKAETGKRKPLVPRAVTTEAPAKASAAFRKNAERILQAAKNRQDPHHAPTARAPAAPAPGSPARTARSPRPTQTASAAPDVTKNPVTENIAGGVTKKGRGRPRSGQALSAAERKRRQRAK